MDVRAAKLLRQEGHDVERAQQWENDPGDKEVLKIAFQTGRVLITLDNDFGRLVVVDGMPHAGLLRIAEFPTSEHAEATLAAVRQYADQLERGALVVYEPDKSRVRE